MTVYLERELKSKIHASGVGYPDLERKIEWRDEETLSETEVYTRASGEVMLVVERWGPHWQWQIVGWLGVMFKRGVADSRDGAKRSVLYWWGRMTIFDRAQPEG